MCNIFGQLQFQLRQTEAAAEQQEELSNLSFFVWWATLRYNTATWFLLDDFDWHLGDVTCRFFPDELGRHVWIPWKWRRFFWGDGTWEVSRPVSRWISTEDGVFVCPTAGCFEQRFILWNIISNGRIESNKGYIWTISKTHNMRGLGLLEVNLHQTCLTAIFTTAVLTFLWQLCPPTFPTLSQDAGIWEKDLNRLGSEMSWEPTALGAFRHRILKGVCGW